MNVKTIRAIRERDEHCWHCGTTSGLVAHHRMNRGMGGSKLLDTPQNLIMVCSTYNNMMESDPRTAAEARELGHKLSKYDTPSQPLFDVTEMVWYELDTKANKKRCDPPSYLI